MRKVFCGLIAVFLFFAVLPLYASDLPPAVGEAFPPIQLTSPNLQDKTYLGISYFSKSFTVSQVKAPLVLIQILSMYCPYCQKEAPNVNALFRKIESDPTLKGKIKIIGIGVGNSAYETDFFRKKYSVPFPVIADPEFIAYKKIGGNVRTPYFFGVRTGEGLKVVYSAKGSLGDPEQFLKSLIKSAELK
jgi:peroxiredoxin